MSKRFFACIGNPPYQDDTPGGNDSFAPPLYNVMMDAASTIADRVEMITPARFLFNAGSTPKAWNEKKLNDPHFKVMEYHADASKVFPRTDIKGGVAVTYHDDTKTFAPIRTFVPYHELNSVLHKVIESDGFESIEKIIYLQNKLNLEALYVDYPQARNVIGSDGKDKRLRSNAFSKLDFVFSDAQENDSQIKVIGLSAGNMRTERWIDSKYIEENGNLDAYKVLVPMANGSGAIGEVLSTPMIGTPMIGYTQSFMGFGAVDKSGVKAIEKYLKSKFARALLGTLKITQHNPPATWRYVPLQNFTSNSDIDWSKPIPDINRQLYMKYGLSDEEIAFIEECVKAMD